MEILAQMFLRELIKQECWDSMMIKGKVLKVNTVYCSMIGSHSLATQCHDSSFHLAHSGIPIEDRSE